MLSTLDFGDDLEPRLRNMMVVMREFETTIEQSQVCSALLTSVAAGRFNRLLVVGKTLFNPVRDTIANGRAADTMVDEVHPRHPHDASYAGGSLSSATKLRERIRTGVVMSLSTCGGSLNVLSAFVFLKLSNLAFDGTGTPRMS